MFSPNSFNISDWARLREIITILAKHGLGEFIVRIKLSTHRRLGFRYHADKKQQYFTAPQRLRMALEELGPTFIKLGQILSTRVDVFGHEWTDELAKLQSHVTPLSSTDIHTLLETQLGPLQQIFQNIDEQPVGSASIAQVHRATLITGETVAIKIKRPDIETVIAADLRILNHLAQLIESEVPELRCYCPVQMVQYFSRSLSKETDFSLEQRNMERFSQLYQNQPNIHIPETYPAYSNRQILVQEFIDHSLLKNTNLINWSAQQRRQLAITLSDAILGMILQHGIFHADPHPGNMMVDQYGNITLIDFGLIGQISIQRRQEILTMIHALIRHDPYTLHYVLSQWATADSTINNQMGEDVMSMLMDYEHMKSADLRISHVISDITAIIRSNQLLLPPDLAMLFKSLMTLDGVVKQIDGEFELLHHAKPIVLRIMQQQICPETLWQRSQNQLHLFAQFLNELPQNLLQFSQYMRKGKLTLPLNIQHLEQLNNQLDRVVNRLTMGIVTAALIIGSSIVMSISVGPSIFGLSFFGLIGYLLAFANCLWVIWSIWRSGKH